MMPPFLPSTATPSPKLKQEHRPCLSLSHRQKRSPPSSQRKLSRTNIHHHLLALIRHRRLGRTPHTAHRIPHIPLASVPHMRQTTPRTKSHSGNPHASTPLELPRTRPTPHHPHPEHPRLIPPSQGHGPDRLSARASDRQQTEPASERSRHRLQLVPHPPPAPHRAQHCLVHPARTPTPSQTDPFLHAYIFQHITSHSRRRTGSTS